MIETMDKDSVRYIIESVIEYAYESIEDEKKEPNSFNSGRALAYWEVLDTIFNRLIICEQDPKDFGYSDYWEKPFFTKLKIISDCWLTSSRTSDDSPWR
ncbi:MAG: hypothetical protein IJQ82_15025 [Selenomonadaceae bacterium]|nr:hypothetical protein [Selenomonadaceae bacterium]